MPVRQAGGVFIDVIPRERYNIGKPCSAVGILKKKTIGSVLLSVLLVRGNVAFCGCKVEREKEKES